MQVSFEWWINGCESCQFNLVIPSSVHIKHFLAGDLFFTVYAGGHIVDSCFGMLHIGASRFHARLSPTAGAQGITSATITLSCAV